MISKLLKILHEHPVGVLGVLFFVGMATILLNLYSLSKHINETMGLQYASLYTESLENFRSYYLKNVVERVRPLGIMATHNYQQHAGTIPLPATLSIELNDEISQKDSNTVARLYSNYPFPWRKNSGVNDVFEKDALAALEKNPQDPFVRFEDYKGQWSLRYARAVVMEEDCVRCHNIHPLSPKTDWKAGQVRGVQELILPIDANPETMQQGLFTTLFLMLTIMLAVLGILWFVIRALHSSILEVRELSQKTEEANEVLKSTNQSFSRFVPYEFLKFLRKRSILEVELGDHTETEMSILFADIRSFTQLSESMSPEENFKFLNSYLNRMEPAVRKHRGFIDKFIGDAIMALFDRSAEDAIQGAITMFEILAEYNQDRGAMDYPSLEIGIGINTGSLMLGTIGGQYRMEGTVISDAVNLASRIEGLTKFYGAPLLISEATFQALKEPNQYKIRFIDQVKVHGKTAPVVIYEIFDISSWELQQKKEATAPSFKEAWQLYQNQELQKASELFQKCLDIFPEDKALQVHHKRCQEALQGNQNSQENHPTLWLPSQRRT